MSLRTSGVAVGMLSENFLSSLEMATRTHSWRQSYCHALNSQVYVRTLGTEGSHWQSQNMQSVYGEEPFAPVPVMVEELGMLQGPSKIQRNHSDWACQKGRLECSSSNGCLPRDSSQLLLAQRRVCWGGFGESITSVLKGKKGSVLEFWDECFSSGDFWIW